MVTMILSAKYMAETSVRMPLMRPAACLLRAGKGKGVAVMGCVGGRVEGKGVKGIWTGIAVWDFEGCVGGSRLLLKKGSGFVFALKLL